MILIFSGLGFLALLVPALLAWLASSLAGPAGADPEAFAMLGVALGGVVVALLGFRLNRDRSAERVAAYRAQRELELHHLVENGAFVLPGGVRPTSIEQARAEAAQLLDAESAQVARAGRGRHTVFWVPMQYVGILEIVVGLVAAVRAGLA